MKYLIFFFVLTIISSCNRSYYCHCEDEYEREIDHKQNRKNVKKECDAFEGSESGDCYVTTDPLD